MFSLIPNHSLNPAATLAFLENITFKYGMYSLIATLEETWHFDPISNPISFSRLLLALVLLMNVSF